MTKWHVLKQNKRKEFDLIQSIFKLSLYLKYLFKSENSKIGHDLFVYNPRVGKHETPKQNITYTGTCPAIRMKNSNMTGYYKLDTVPNGIK